MERIKKNLKFLEMLSESKPEMRKAILCHSSCDQVRTICDCVLNMLLNRIPLDDKSKKILKKKKTFFRKLILNKKLNLNAKKKILSQSGSGWMSLLLPAALEVFRTLSK